MKPIHKFNNGRGAMLCNICRTIISTGPATKELYCEKCKPKQETIEEVAFMLMPDRNGFTNRDRFNFIEGANYREIMVNALKVKLERSYSEEEVYKLLDIVLINPSHITMLKNGYGQFPDTYEITEKGVDYIIEQFKKK